MISLRKSALICACILATPLPAGAQGITEYGSLLGTQGKPPTGVLQDAVNSLYGNAARRISAPQGEAGSRQTQTYAEVDPDQLRQYGEQSNRSFLAGKKAAQSGKLDLAIKLYSDALNIRQRYWGDSDPAVPVLLQQRAELYKKKGKLPECERDYKHVLAIDARRSGSGAVQSQKTLDMLGELCARQGKHKEAAGYYSRLLDLRLKDPSPDSMSIKALKLKLANSLSLSEDYAGAEHIYKDALSVEDHATTPDKQYHAKLIDGYGKLLRMTKRDQEADALEHGVPDTKGTPTAAGQPAQASSPQ